MNSENAKLSREIKDLQTQVKELLKRSKVKDKPEFDLTQVIAATTEAVIQQIYAQRDALNAPSSPIGEETNVNDMSYDQDDQNE